MDTTTAPDVRLKNHRPEPANLWIRHSVVLPPPAEPIWMDLSIGELGDTRDRTLQTGRRSTPTDLVYVPPSSDRQRHESVVRWCDSIGIPTLIQHVLGQEPPRRGELSSVVVDLLPALLANRLAEVEPLPAGSLVVWPVVAGLTDEPGLVRDGLETLRAANASCVVPFPLKVSPIAGRRLTETFGERIFDSVFHAAESDPRPVARAIHREGLEFLAPRPQLPGARALNRQVATQLATIGELLSATSDSPAPAQEFFRAAAWLDNTHHDVAALSREGNLGIVPSLSERVAEVVAEIANGTEASARLADSVRRYIQSPA